MLDRLPMQRNAPRLRLSRTKIIWIFIRRFGSMCRRYGRSCHRSSCRRGHGRTTVDAVTVPFRRVTGDQPWPRLPPSLVHSNEHSHGDSVFTNFWVFFAHRKFAMPNWDANSWEEVMSVDTNRNFVYLKVYMLCFYWSYKVSICLQRLGVAHPLASLAWFLVKNW